METKTDNIKPPFVVAILDLIDTYHYADFFDKERYAFLGVGDYAKYVNYEMIVQLADRLFWALNPDAKTQEDWIEWDAGYDVRVYDADSACVYKAHSKLPEK